MSEHSGVWPHYEHARTRRIAGLDEHGTVFDSSGKVLTTGADYASVRALAETENLDIYVDDLTHERRIDLLFDALEDERAQVTCSLSGGVVGVRLQGAKQRSYMLGQCSAWGIKHLTVDALASVASLTALLGAGTYVSPGALGEAHWRASRRDQPRVSVPCLAARVDLLGNIVGGRVDTPALGESFAEAYESDIRSAYPALSVRVPSGTASSLIGEPETGDGVATYFASCVVVVPVHGGARCISPISLSVPALGGVSPGSHAWVRRVFSGVPGQYSCWLWAEEIAAARAAGFTVTVRHGWYWSWWDTHNRTWLARLANARRAAPHEGVGRLAKRVGVAAIGRHGMSGNTYELRMEAQADPATDKPLVIEWAGEPILGLWLHSEPGKPSHHLPHWYSYILAKCRLALYERYIAEERAGNRVLLSNFDALVTAKPPTEPTSETDEPGTWKQSTLHDLEIVAPRSYKSRERTVLPGVRREA